MPTISFSKAKTYRRCQKQYDFRYNQRLRRKRRSVPLLRGNILHEMITAHYDRNATEKPAGILARYEKEYSQFFREEQEQYGDVIPDIRRIFEGYLREYSNDDLTYHAHEEFLATDLTSETRFIGYLDKRVRDKHGRHWIMDHKSHKSIPDDDQRFSDLQLAFYVWAYNREHPEDKVDGIIWDYLRTKAPVIPETLIKGGLSQRKNMDTDYHTYYGEVKRLNLDPRDYEETLMRLKKETNSFHKRIFLPSPPKELLDNVVSDLRTTAILISKLGKTAITRNMTRDCASGCDYYNLCQAELRGLDSDFIKKTEYEEKEPDEHNYAEVE